ncbi:MAG: glycerophosphoryl diester phosphodiesterase membrane domain-containing protein [Erysipelotrichaceae bacterium]|nr:glycerophosphoryl diester phosphodiesterase membrane domain-containing protein [Erysipelotrichaceae bacterium]
MKLKQSLRQNVLPYLRAIPDICGFQIINGLLLYLMMLVFKQIAMVLIRSTGRVAISTGDFWFLFTTWQGPLLLIIGMAILFLYVAFDLNTQIIYSSTILKGQADLKGSIRKGLISIREFFTPDGIGIVLYIALIAPIVGTGFTISLTDSLYLPSFIASVIETTPLYSVLYYIFVWIFIFLGIIHIFILHGILLGGLKSNKADDQSRQIMKQHWKNYLLENLRLLLIGLLLIVFDLLLTGLLPSMLFLFFGNIEHYKTAVYFILMLVCINIVILTSFFQSFYMIHMTRLYYRYTGKDDSFALSQRKISPILSLLFTAALFAVLYFASWILSNRFDQIFSTQITTKIIAHRAGGIEAPENTLAGLEEAIRLGAAGAEIDIQRTKDGHYIINHDASFARLCSNKARPEELTLEEVKALTIQDPLFPDRKEEVATFEEMLESAKGRIVLFVELKGNTADQKMADDAVRMIKEKGMEDQCVLISLKYSLIDYIERNYPEMQTAYLTFASFGKTAEFNCDYLGLEEEAVSGSIIDALHESKRGVLVWTPNTEAAQRKFLISDADYIITDNVKQAIGLIETLDQREDFEVIIDWIFN